MLTKTAALAGVDEDTVDRIQQCDYSGKVSGYTCAELLIMFWEYYTAHAQGDTGLVDCTRDMLKHLLEKIDRWDLVDSLDRMGRRA